MKLPHSSSSIEQFVQSLIAISRSLIIGNSTPRCRINHERLLSQLFQTHTEAKYCYTGGTSSLQNNTQSPNNYQINTENPSYEQLIQNSPKKKKNIHQASSSYHPNFIISSKWSQN